MHLPQTSAYAASAAAPCTCGSLPAQLARAPVSQCMKIVVSTGAGGAFLAEKVDCGSAYCRSSAQYAATQGWMGSLEQRMGTLKL
ncbi:hypothetical protein PsYK624_135560 [Phanerochaete sordida]|uniref:Uncharacterized protein n=1 Tax=Phanerochaete sordida TaxID=48140 RepID=A0A9P3GL83_9APHY|nr:hypothetical protein PsYK624_135560 [Phanerochaete sordida]